MRKREMSKYFRTLFVLLSVLFLSSAVQAAMTINVPGDQPTIQGAINTASDGDTVLVADGTYNELIDFGIKHITIKSVNGAVSTTIDGTGKSGSVVTFNNNGAGSVLEGFTITNGSGTVAYLDKKCGGGIICITSSPTITNCTISGNKADVFGGGVYCLNYSSPIITNCTISGNEVITDGGGIACNEFSSPTIINCIISGNKTGGVGGGIECLSSSPTITNCIISGNSAFMGGGILCLVSSPTITNCTISQNSALMGGGIACFNSSPVIKNSILWGDVSAEIDPADLNVTYSDVDQDGYAGSNGNIRQDPLFVNATAGDFHLQAGSPCIDAGTPDGAPGYDIEGTTRPQGSGYDMGAYEYKKKEIIVAVDIKPGSCPNPIKLKEIGVMPFAIMGAVDFDISQIDPKTIRLSREGNPGEVAPLRWSYYDAGIPNEEFDPTLCNCVGYGYDGIIDLALKFNVQSVIKILSLDEVVGQTIPLTMTGKLKEEFGGTPITGKDCVRVLRK